MTLNLAEHLRTIRLTHSIEKNRNQSGKGLNSIQKQNAQLLKHHKRLNSTDGQSNEHELS